MKWKRYVESPNSTGHISEPSATRKRADCGRKIPQGFIASSKAETDSLAGKQSVSPVPSGAGGRRLWSRSSRAGVEWAGGRGGHHRGGCGQSGPPGRPARRRRRLAGLCSVPATRRIRATATSTSVSKMRPPPDGRLRRWPQPPPRPPPPPPRSPFSFSLRSVRQEKRGGKLSRRAGRCVAASRVATNRTSSSVRRSAEGYQCVCVCVFVCVCVCVCACV